MELSIVVPSRYGRRKISGLLASLAHQENPPPYELIVVANPPDEKLRRLLDRHPHARYLTSAEGANAARNVGVGAAQGKTILFIDDDCRPQDPLFLRKHLSAHKEYPSAAGIGGPYAPPTDRGAVARAYHERQHDWLERGPCPGYRAFPLLGGNMSFKRDSLGERPFEEALRYGGTETELVFRLAAEGKEILFRKDIVVGHDVRLGLLSFLQKAARQGRGAAFLARRRFYGLPLVVRKVGDARTGPLHLLYEIFFQAGYRLGMGAENPQFFLPRVWINACIEAARFSWRSLKHLVMVEFWCSVEAAIRLGVEERKSLKNTHNSSRSPGDK